MCGITGLYAYNELGRVHSINLQKSLESIEHRGSDQRGTYLSERCFLGHARLAVIDLDQRGKQPFSDSTGRYQLVFNGEIYNYKELREGLLQRNYDFRTETDTEVLLYHLIEFGTKGLDNLNGFFAFALYDSHENHLLLARDRFGIKPLLYYQDEDKFIFSSELQGILAYGLERKLNPQAVLSFLNFNYISEPSSIYQGMESLGAGHYLRVGKKVFEKENWYNPPFHPGSYKGSFTDAATELKEKLALSVESRLVSDVPLGGFLSGGIDSSILCYLAKQKNEGFKTFTVKTDNQYLDESKDAEDFASHIGSDHTTLFLSESSFEKAAVEVLENMHNPFADSSSIAVKALSEEIRKHVTVAISGDGADELLGGYVKYQGFQRSFRPGIVEHLTANFAGFFALAKGSRSSRKGNFFRRLERFGRAFNLDPGDRYWYWTALNSFDESLSLMHKELHIDQKLFQNSLNLNIPFSKPKNINEVLDNDLKQVLTGDMLYKVDHYSMAHALEVRVPFLDHEFVEFCRSLPPDYKVSKGKGKLILREAFKNDLPSGVFQRRKRGFEVPLDNILKGSLSSRVKLEFLSSKDNPLEAILNMDQIESLKESYFSNSKSDLGPRIWNLCCLQAFLRRETP